MIGGSGLAPVEVNLDAVLSPPQLELRRVRATDPELRRVRATDQTRGLAPSERPPLVDINSLDPSLLAPAPRTPRARPMVPAPARTGKPTREVDSLTAPAPARTGKPTREVARLTAPAPMPRAGTRIPATSLAAEIGPVGAAEKRPTQPPKQTVLPSLKPSELPAARRAPAAETEDAATPTTEVAAVPSAPAPTPSGVITRLIFATGSAEVSGPLAQQLDIVVSSMKSRDERLLVQAYAAAGQSGASGARRLSLARSLEVRSHLIRKGLKSTRIDVRALGTAAASGPADRVDIILLTR